MRGGLEGLARTGLYGDRSIQRAYAASFPVGTYTWTVPYSGYYRFVQWGAGALGAANNGGGSGAHTQTVVFLTRGSVVQIFVPSYLSVAACTVTLPNGRVISAGSASGAVGGTASGGDININGSAGGTAAGGTNGAAGGGDGGGAGGAGDGSTTGGGAGAPGKLPFRGGSGGAPAPSPGGGGNGTGLIVGQGAVYINRQFNATA